MTISTEIAAMTEETSTLMRRRLGVRGKTMEARVRKSRRLLPGAAGRDAEALLQAEQMASHPRMARLIDEKSTRAAQKRLNRALKAVDPADRRRGFVLGMLGGMAFNLLLATALLIVFMRWQGLV